MVEFTRFGRRPTGDIRNFPRKNALENSLLDFSTDKFQSEQILLLKQAVPEINKIYVIGSWGRGTAIPFISDLDFIIIPETSTETYAELNHPITMKTDFIIFNSVDIFTEFDFTVDDFLINLVENGGGFLTFEEPHIAYNLTDRQDIFLENGELRGLGL